MRKLSIILFVALMPAAAFAQSMPVSTFIKKADALEKKGALALFSGDIGKLKKEIGNSAKQVRAEQVAAVKAGKKPATCLPEKASVNSKELLEHFRAIPPARRNITVKAAFVDLMRKKYPCPA